VELVNALWAANVCDKAVAEELVIMLTPFAPHFAEELWKQMGHTESVFEARWPAWDEGLVVEEFWVRRLKKVANRVDIVFFYPVIYRVDMDRIPSDRVFVAGSGLTGSAECLIPDLSEILVRFYCSDYRVDADFRQIVIDEYLGVASTNSATAHMILEGRC
jgi:hypothetical protein